MNSGSEKQAVYLSPRYQEMLKTVAETFMPPGGPFETGARDLDLEGLFNRLAKGFDPLTLFGFKFMFSALNYLPLFFIFKPRTLKGLSPEDRVRYMEKWENSRNYSIRGVFTAIKALVGILLYSDDLIEKNIKYESPCRPEAGLKTRDPAIREFEDIGSELKQEFDVCVIGSGAGGAVAAKELAESGFKTLVLEEGAYYATEDFHRKPIDSLPLYYRNNSMVFTLGSPIVPLSVGKGIGGTTTINSGTCFRAPAEVLAEWAEDYYLKGLSIKTIAPYYERVEKIINVLPGDMAVIGKNALVTKRGAEALGLSHGPLLRNVRGCGGCGSCNYGCPEGSKQSMDKTYIPLAIKAGAKVFAGCRVDKILHENGRAVGVSGVVLDRETGKPKIPFTVKSKIVIVACGAVFSPALLLRNHIANRNGQVGRHLRIHPCARVSALFDEEIEQWKGIMQSYYIDTYQKEGIMLEATGLAPAVAAASLPFFGLKQKELMSRFKNIVNLGLLVSDSSEGRVRSAGGRPLITYFINHEDFLKTLKGLKLAIEVMFAAGAKEVYTGVAPYPVINSKDQMSLLTEKNVRKTDIEYMAFHPMGSCRMGDNPAQAVVNRNLESHEVKNLFISDAGIFPTSLGVNPQLSIMAYSTYLAEYLKENRGKYFQ